MAHGGEYARLFTLQSRGYVGNAGREAAASGVGVSEGVVSEGVAAVAVPAEAK